MGGVVVVQGLSEEGEEDDDSTCGPFFINLYGRYSSVHVETYLFLVWFMCGSHGGVVVLCVAGGEDSLWF